jgi:hypothetical protein
MLGDYQECEDKNYSYALQKVQNESYLGDFPLTYVIGKC